MWKQLRDNKTIRDSMVMTIASISAGGFDYLTNVLAGSRLTPVEFSVFVAVIALLQIVMHGTHAIRYVVAFYSAQLTAISEPIRPFLIDSGRWAICWGAVAMGLMIVLSPLLQHIINIDTMIPFLPAGVAVLLLFIRPVTDGFLQGTQDFVGLASVTLMQAVLRTLLTIFLIMVGLKTVGALLALPIAAFIAGSLAWWRLIASHDSKKKNAYPVINSLYSIQTVIGLVAFAVLINIDAILVRSFFNNTLSGDYSAVITLRKINLFIPLALGMVLFPKAVARQQAGDDPRPLLWLVMSITIASGVIISMMFFLFPTLLIKQLLGEAYDSLGIVLGWSGMATTLFAAINIWLNYALAQQEWTFIWSLAIIVVCMIIGILFWHNSLLIITGWLLAAGIAGNIAGIFLSQRSKLN